MKHKKIPTTSEVWAAIESEHHNDLVVFSSFSAPAGNYYGNPKEGRMMTEFGFKDADCPLMGIDTRWDIAHDNPHNRINERHNYWLCAPIDSQITLSSPAVGRSALVGRS